MQTDEDTLRLGRVAQRRAYVLNQVLAGVLTIGEAAPLLGLSLRQTKRLKTRYRREGPAALVHGNQARPPWNAVAVAVRANVVQLARTTFAGLNDQHLTKKLEEHGLYLDRSTVRRILVAAAAAPPRPHPPPPTAAVPLGRAAATGRRQPAPLVRAGRASGGAGGGHRRRHRHRAWAVFRAHEDAAGYLLLIRGIASAKGLPHALYLDRHGIFQQRRHEPLSLEEELAGGRLPTQVGRALEALGIRRIDAQSPQAKGRIERLWRTLQDRLVAELRLAGITTIEQANAFLSGFLACFNERFAVPPAEPEPAWRPLPDDLDLERVLCFQYERVVRADNTIAFAGRTLQLLPGRDRLNWARPRRGPRATRRQPGGLLPGHAHPDRGRAARRAHPPRPHRTATRIRAAPGTSATAGATGSAVSTPGAKPLRAPPLETLPPGTSPPPHSGGRMTQS